MEFRFAKTIFNTSINNVSSSCPHLLNITCKIYGIGKYWVDGIGGMLFVQLGNGHSWRQLAGVPNLQTVFEQHYLNTAIACVAAMYHGIDNGLCDGLWRQFGYLQAD